MTSTHLPEAARWPIADTPAAATPTQAATPFAAVRHRLSGGRTSGHQSTADAIQLARAASNAAKQSLAATAAITDCALPRKGSSSLLADLRQAEQQWMQVAQASTPAQPVQPAEVKRSSRQAARAADSSYAIAAEQDVAQAAAEAEAAALVHSAFQPLRWGKQVRVQRARSHRPAAKAGDRFHGWTVSGGILKPVAARQAPAAVGAPARAAARAVSAEGRAFRVEPGLFKSFPASDTPAEASQPVLLPAAAAVKAPEEIAAAFIPRHSRKKVGATVVARQYHCNCLVLTADCIVSLHQPHTDQHTVYRSL